MINLLFGLIVILLGGVVYAQVMAVQKMQSKLNILIKEFERIIGGQNGFNEKASGEINKLQDWFMNNNTATLNLFAAILKINPTGEPPSSSVKE